MQTSSFADTRPVKIKGGPDRDARGIPYDFGNRAARRKANAKVNEAANGIRKARAKAAAIRSKQV